MMRPCISMHEAGTKQRNCEFPPEMPLLLYVCISMASSSTKVANSRSLFRPHVPLLKEGVNTPDLSGELLLVLSSSTLTASHIAAMVFRITITGKEKDVIVDIEDSVNNLGSQKSEGANPSKGADNGTAVKRDRDPASSVDGYRASPYQPRTPVDVDISEIGQTS